MMRRTATLSLSAALALGGAACGNDEDGDGGTTDEEIQDVEDNVDDVQDDVEDGVDDVEDDVEEEIDAQDEGDNQDDEG